jgi:membrane associated rhomboid family serine protease
MLLPYNVDVPMQRMPVANWALIACTCLVSFIVFLKPDESINLPPINLPPDADFNELIVQLDKLEKERIPALALQPQHFSILQLFTHVLVHADLLHLAGNMLFLFVFGNAVNAKLGHGTYLLIYFLLGAVSGIAWLIFGNGMPAVGASGAISGITGIFLVFFPRNDVRVYFFWNFSWESFSLSALWLVLFYMLWDLIGTLFLGQGGIAYVAHLAGECIGLALGIGLAMTAFGPEDYEENLLQLLGLEGRKEDEATSRLKTRVPLKSKKR